MNGFDIFALVLGLLCFYFGFHTGIIASVFYVASGFVGMWAAQAYAAKFGLNFYVAFLCAAASVALAGFILSRIFRALMLGFFDRIIGGVLGVALAVCIVAMAIVPVSSKFTPAMRSAVVSSYAVKKIVPCFRKMFPRVKHFDITELSGKISLPALPHKLEFDLLSSTAAARGK